MQLMTADGRVSAYGLACGYVERVTLGATQLSLWCEHGVYHVRAHEFGGHGRLFWDSFRLLGAARKRFDVAANMIQLSGSLAYVS